PCASRPSRSRPAWSNFNSRQSAARPSFASSKMAARSQSSRLLVRLLGGLCLLGTLALGCATYSDKTMAMRELVTAGQYDAGLQEVNKFLKVKDVDELPSDRKSETWLAALEPATILHAMQRREARSRNCHAADAQ